jgi:predicted RNase H-like HicB family nuclease
MNKYEIIVYWSEIDNAYLAEVPELAGCMADGQTYSEAVQNVDTVIFEWLETAQLLGRDIPIPKGKLMYA